MLRFPQPHSRCIRSRGSGGSPAGPILVSPTQSAPVGQQRYLKCSPPIMPHNDTTYLPKCSTNLVQSDKRVFRSKTKTFTCYKIEHFQIDHSQYYILRYILSFLRCYNTTKEPASAYPTMIHRFQAGVDLGVLQSNFFLKKSSTKLVTGTHNKLLLETHQRHRKNTQIKMTNNL